MRLYLSFSQITGSIAIPVNFSLLADQHANINAKWTGGSSKPEAEGKNNYSPVKSCEELFFIIIIIINLNVMHNKSKCTD